MSVFSDQLMIPGGIVELTDQHVHVQFETARRGLSSAVLNGGYCRADHYLNLRVPDQVPPGVLPEDSLSNYAANTGWSGTTVGMVTTASMESFRVTDESCSGVDLAVLVTSGLANPRRAGDYADVRNVGCSQEPVGTINILAITSARLTDSAMVEAIMIITEAKAAALQEDGIKSPVSGALATGTGTDSHGIFCGEGPEIGYCGKHVLFGEMLGRLTIDAVRASIG